MISTKRKVTGTAVYGTVRTVVREDGGRKPSSYPIWSNGSKEYWNNGMSECWVRRGDGLRTHYSTVPLFHHSDVMSGVFDYAERSDTERL